VGLAVLANGLWGAMPLYFKGVSDVPSLEVMLHRVVWCALLMWAGLLACGRLGLVWPVLRSPRTVAILGVTGLLLMAQWWAYIRAVEEGQLLQSSFGYFLAPMMNVLLGVLLLRERLRPGQWLAVGLALAGTLSLCGSLGGFPWLGLVIGLSFGLYAVVRKRLEVHGVVGLLVETTVLLPAALAMLLALGSARRFGFGAAGGTSLLLALSGAVTAAPLLAYVGAARRLPLPTLGAFQYLSPTLQFFLAVLAYGEPVSGPRLLSFLIIWVGLALYSLESVWMQARGVAGECAEQRESEPGEGRPGSPEGGDGWHARRNGPTRECRRETNPLSSFELASLARRASFNRPLRDPV
jgi:chloramphenicol-sensitive protein RarD